MTEDIEDLTPFFEDRCWMFVHLARQAHVGVILRRGPTEWWRVTLWDTQSDRFEAGQWFRGHLYPDRCDISPDGKLFVYFGGKFSPRSEAKGYKTTWTAVSRPPYLTALALWPMGGTWGGDGVFLDNQTVRLSTFASPDYNPQHHPDHPPGPLRVLGLGALKKDDPRSEAEPSCQSGWQGILATNQPNHFTSYAAWRKTSGDLILERETAREMDPASGAFYHADRYPSRRRSLYTLRRLDGEPAAQFEAHWADWDQNGRLVATVGGRVLAGKLTKNKLFWRQLASMHEERPTPMEAPAWAQRW